MLAKINAEAAAGYIKSPFEYTHVKWVRWLLILVGYWPFKECEGIDIRWPWIFAINNVIWTSFLTFATTGYLVVHRTELTFMELVQILLTIAMSFLASQRVLTVPLSAKYKKTIGYFFNTIHHVHHKHRSEYAMEIHKQVHLYCSVFGYFLCGTVIVGSFVNNLSFIYGNFADGRLSQRYLNDSKYEYLIYYIYPSDATTNRNTYIYVSIFNFFVSYQWCFNIFIVDLCVIMVVFHIWGHFKILRHNLYAMPRPARKQIGTVDGVMFSIDELKTVSTSLKECVNYHRFIISYVNDMSSTFGPMFLSYYIFQQMSCCLFLMICSDLTLAVLMRYGLLTGLIFSQLVLMYTIFEIIGTASEEIIDAVYNVPWDCMDSVNRKTVFIFMMMTQKPVHIKAMGMVNMGLASMTSILKTSFSYFMFLRTIPDAK